MTSPDPQQTKFILDESRIPRAWYNIAADLPMPPSPPLHPGTRPADRTRRPGAAVPDGAHRPGGLDRATRSRSPSRSATRIACTGRVRCFERIGSSGRSIPRRTSTTSTRAAARPAATSRTRPSRRRSTTSRKGVKRLATETGAGQWGSALAFAGALFGLEVKVYMVRASYDQKPYRRILMETYGAEVVASPSPDTNYGRSVLGEHPDSPGSLGHGHQRGGRGRGHARRHQVRPRLRPQPRAAAPDGHRPGGDRADGRWPASHRTSSSAAPAAAPTSPGLDVPVPRPELPGGRDAPDHRRRAGGRARA